MEDSWILLAEAAALSGLSTKAVDYRAKAYGLPVRKVRFRGATTNPYRIKMRRGDVPHLALKPRSAYKSLTLPAPPGGMVLLSTIATDHGVSPRTLRGRICTWKVPHSRIDHRYIVAQEDIPLLFKRPATAPAYRTRTLSLALDGAGIPEDSGGVVQFIAAQFQIDPALVYGRERTAHVVEVRHIAIAVLHRLGLYPAQLGRHFGRDHATICHALDKVKADAHRDALAQELLGYMATDDPRTNLDTQLEYTLQDTRMSVIAAIRAYLRYSLLGWERHSASTVATGIGHLAADDAVRNGVVNVLKRLGLGQHIGRMESHIAASGYRRAAS